MERQEVLSLIEQKIRENDAKSRFTLTPINSHNHDSVNSPPVYSPTVSYAGFVPYQVQPDSGLQFFMPKGWKVDHPNFTITFTGALVMGATSATLTTAFNDSVALGFVLFITFSNGDVRVGNFSMASTSVTWTGGLSAAATDTATVNATGQYLITHNIGTQLYAFVAIPTQSTNVVATCVTETLTDVVFVTWFDAASLTDPVDTSFEFILTQINNRSTQFPQYTTRNIS